MEHTTRQLLDLPDGLHFRNLEMPWHEEDDLLRINALVVRCFDTFEGFKVVYRLPGTTVWPLRWNQ